MFILLLLVYIIVLVSLDWYWTHLLGFVWEVPVGEEIPSNLGI